MRRTKDSIDHRQSHSDWERDLGDQELQSDRDALSNANPEGQLSNSERMSETETDEELRDVGQITALFHQLCTR